MGFPGFSPTPWGHPMGILMDFHDLIHGIPLDIFVPMGFSYVSHAEVAMFIGKHE